jgi:hypothetical protein
VDVPDRVLTITKTGGASRQVEEAIKALRRGDFDVAVTLAGAAVGEDKTARIVKRAFGI